MEGRRGARSFRDVERVVERYTQGLSQQARLEKSGRAAGPGRPSYIAQLYRANRAGAARQILDGPREPCRIPPRELHRHFSGVFGRDDARGGAPRPEGLSRLPPVESPAVLGQPFTPGEVSEKFGRTKDSAPGPDEIPFGLLKRWDPTGAVLAGIFEDCRRFRRTPAAWKRAEAFLSFKEGDPADPASWRPLALCNTMYKLYAKCLARRLLQWAQAGAALSPQQKGLQGLEGCAQQRFLLQAVLQVARSTGKECALAFLDLADASGSLPRSRLFETLAEFGMPGDFLGLLQEFFEGCTMTIKVQGKKTAAIPLRTGLKQGCPLSPVLLNLALEPLLRFIDGRAHGFGLYHARVGVLAYADDLVLVAETPGELQAMLDDATAAADWMGLRFNAGKCKSLHLKGGAHQATTFTLQDEAVYCPEEGETITFLKMPVGVQRQAGTLVGDFAANVDKVKASRLTRGQKADMLRTSLLPRILPRLRDQPGPQEDLRKIDSIIANALSGWDPGARELRMEELSDIDVVTHTFRLLSSPDGVVKDVARDALRDVVRESFTPNPDGEDLASYLSGLRESEVRHNNEEASIWTRARRATRRLNRLVSCRWVYDGELHVTVSGCVRFPHTLEGVLKRAMRKKKENQQGVGNRRGY